jgi:hypothetical protein
MALCKILLRCPIVQSLVRSHILPQKDRPTPIALGLGLGAPSPSHHHIPHRIPPCVSYWPVPSFMGRIEFRGSRRQDKEGDVPLLASLLKHGLKLTASVYLYGPDSIGGIRRIRPRWNRGKPWAIVAVALVCTSSTSQRETTSRAVKCFSTTPGRGRSSRVSTPIPSGSPGWRT